MFLFHTPLSPTHQRLIHLHMQWNLDFIRWGSGASRFKCSRERENVYFSVRISVHLIIAPYPQTNLMFSSPSQSPCQVYFLSLQTHKVYVRIEFWMKPDRRCPKDVKLSEFCQTLWITLCCSLESDQDTFLSDARLSVACLLVASSPAIYDMTHSYVWRTVCICDMTHSYVWHIIHT